MHIMSYIVNVVLRMSCWQLNGFCRYRAAHSAWTAVPTQDVVGYLASEYVFRGIS
jgi:hypothetical protein